MIASVTRARARVVARAQASARARAVRPLLIAAGVALAGVGAVGGWSGLVVGTVLAVGAYRWLSRRPTGMHLAEERRVEADLPFAVDLLAAALRAGASPDAATRTVSRAVGGPLGDRLARVDRALRLGAPSEEAWSYLASAGGAHRVVQAASRSAQSGAAFAGSLQRLSDDLRSDRLIAADAAARRAGVLIVLPLGLCFLPAFVLAGLVPVIVAILGGVLSP